MEHVNNNIKAHENVFLIVEDNPVDVEIVRAMLEEAYQNNYKMLWAECFAEAENILATKSIDALILDMNLPDFSGPANVTELNNQYPHLPIVVLTGYDDQAIALETIQYGAQDFLVKNDISPQILARSLHYAKERKKLENTLKQSYADLSHKNGELEAIARTDYLTQLPNRSYFESSIQRCIEQAKRSKKEFALLYLDLNNFKKINDKLGHAAGDELLVVVAQRLKVIVRDTDFIARIGGDEFVIFTDLLHTKDEVYQLIDRILDQFEQPCLISEKEVKCVLSIGVSFYPDAPTLAILMKHADYSMYEAKQSNMTNVGFYTKEMDTKYARKMQIESQFDKAIEAGEFDVHFQKITSTSNPDSCLFEALLRWESSTLGQVEPDEFIPIFENDLYIDQLTYIVLEKSKHLINALNHKLVDVDCIKVNVTASQLSSEEFGHQFIVWLKSLELDPEKFCLELTERQVVENTKACLAQINILRQHGVSIALDDFGTGYSSVKHLLNFPIDYLKLDISLIKGLENKPKNQALMAGIIEMVHRLGLIVVAEGIETEAEYICCQELNCDLLQGYYLHYPSKIDDVVNYILT